MPSAAAATRSRRLLARPTLRATLITACRLIDEDTFGTIDEAEFFDFCGERRFFVFGAGEAFVRCRQEQQRLEDNFLGEGFRQGKNPVRGETAADLCEMRRADKDEDTAEIRKK